MGRPSDRASFSTEVLNAVIENTSWGKDIPFGVIKRAFPQGVTPAEESDKGRGNPVFDIYRPNPNNWIGADLVSVKISCEDRNPRNVVLSTGKAEHIQGVLYSLAAGLDLPVICWNYVSAEDRWYEIRFNAAEIIRAHPPVEADGSKGNPVTLSRARRAYRDRVYWYVGLRVNFQPSGLEWEEIESPIGRI